MKKDDRKRFTLRLPTPLFSQLQEEAELAGTPLNAFILNVLWDWSESKNKGSESQ